MSDIKAVVHSALWAAYGDALGYMTELADREKVKRRTGSVRVTRLQSWTRVLPGRPPKSVDFMPGTYSDDTQLRLATSRSIRADGRFDVAAFAKVELPTWTNYALGAGISSKEAAFSLAKASTHWYSNFFQTKRSSYIHGGGNGSAMRIQPHVWAASDAAGDGELLKDVIRNAICTHGHPRGIVGAAYHALCLRFAMVERRLPGIKELHDIAMSMEGCWNLIESDSELRLFWLPQLSSSRSADVPPEQAFGDVAYELVSDVERLRSLGSSQSGASYAEGLQRIGLYDADSRGSGTKTALIAAWLAWQFERRGVQAAVVEASNALGSDTDTIGTMVGALMGAVASEPPPEAVQDAAYIVEEAERLHAVSCRKATRSFGYPDLRAYKPPKAAIDAVYADGSGYVLAGIGRAEPISEFLTSGEQAGDLRWLRLTFGQTVLAHIRQNPKDVSSAGQNLFEPSRLHTDLRRSEEISQNPKASVARTPSIDVLSSSIIAGGFNPEEFGSALFRLSDGPDDYYLERMASLATVIGRAYRNRKRS